MKTLFITAALVMLLHNPALAANPNAAGLEAPAPGAALSAPGDQTATPAAQPANSARQASPATPTANVQGCADDPRLDTIGQWLGGPPLNPPLTITPETFITLDQEVVAMLAGQAVICPKISLLKSGKTIRKVAVSFDALWNQLQSAAVRDDVAAMERLRDTFIAAPLSPEKVVALAVQDSLEQKASERLRKTLGMAETHRDHMQIVDYFIAFGGKSTENVKVLVGSPHDARYLEQMPKGALFALKLPFATEERTASQLAKAGLTAGTQRSFNLK